MAYMDAAFIVHGSDMCILYAFAGKVAAYVHPFCFLDDEIGYIEVSFCQYTATECAFLRPNHSSSFENHDRAVLAVESRKFA